MENNKIQLVECPRDAMQGWQHFIPTEQKIKYLNTLLQVGFDTLDFGSFVSPKAIPQMADTIEVIKQLDLSNTSTKLLAIIANPRGAADAVCYDEISYLGFPFSISPTFQLRNTNSTQEESLQRIDEIQELCVKNNKQLVVYLSMGFGNPYGDIYNQDILLKWADEMVNRNIEIISLADTVGLGTAEQINMALTTLIPKYQKTTFGVHLHSTQLNWKEKLQASIDAGCIRFDGALKGIGGCPMAQDDLVGNMDSEKMIKYFEERNVFNNYNKEALLNSLILADKIFI
ncbi:MAG: hydroxymethylglutaryl-CoA lyase [Chitinophagaceae bacterium]